jgi:hypothetical protein
MQSNFYSLIIKLGLAYYYAIICGIGFPEISDNR